MTQQDKNNASELLKQMLPKQAKQVATIEPRLFDYYADLCQHPEHHNAYELLSAIKYLRLLRTYVLDLDTIHDVIYKYEGIWEKRNGVWEHISGGLKHPGTTGATYYRLQPFQVFVLAAMFSLKAWINTEAPAGSRALLPTEKEQDGTIYDLRSLCTEFTDFTPRKTAKTQLSAFVQFWYFMSGDDNAECYCCANASDQAKILFSRTRELIHQMDPKEKRIRFTASQVNWKPGQFRSASLTALSAGGKTKDGLFAQLCSADEYGSAAYVNGASDMGKLVSVVESSMGPRREPMTFISTTAGIITAGPFIDKLRGIKNMLLTELDDTYPHNLSTDRQMCLLLEPDEWEQQDEELLLTDKDVRRKVNPMLGVIVQHSFYEDEIAKARQNPEKKNEVISKLLNVYQTGRVTQWIKGDRIRPLQTDRRISDCKYEDGWGVFVGLDFSHGDDLFAITYLGVNYHQSDNRGRFFADTEAWVLEATMNESPNKALYEQWVARGWLHVCPGEVFDSAMAIAMLAAKHEQRINMTMFGYDPAQSVQPINNLKAWLQSLGIDGQSVINMVVPVGQSAMTQNPRVSELEDLIKSPEQLLLFSNSPLWPWCFGNAAVETNTSDLRRILKGGPAPTCKIDPVAALVDALYCFDLSEGRIER